MLHHQCEDPKREALMQGTATRARKVLFIGEAVSLAHVGRPAILARWAREAGYTVRFACGTAYAHLARGEGFEPLDLTTISPATFYSRLNAGVFFYTQDELTSYVEAERAMIRRIKPDLIVSDFRLTLAISARLEGVRLLTLQQAHWSPASEFKVPSPCKGTLGLLPRGLRSILFAALRPIAYRTFAAPLDAVRKRYGMARRQDFRANYTDGDFCAYLDLPELMPVTGTPCGHFFLGPLFWEPRHGQTKSKYIQDQRNAIRRKNKRPMAYVSMGSSGDTGILSKVFQALENLGYDAVVSGLRNKVDSSNIRYVGTIKPSTWLPQSSLTICHGGAGTIYQSLTAGVPVLCLPSNPDQEMISRGVERFGAGYGLPAELVTTPTLSRYIQKTTSEKRREAATRLALSINTHDTRSRWLTWLHETLSVHNIEFALKDSRHHPSRQKTSAQSREPSPAFQK